MDCPAATRSYACLVMVATVMGDQDATLARSPFQDDQGIGARETRVLHSQKIDRELASEQSAHDVVVEVLVDGQQDHSAGAIAGRSAGQKAVTHPLRVEAPFILLAQGLAGSTSGFPGNTVALPITIQPAA